MIERSLINVALMLGIICPAVYADTYFEVKSPEIFESEFKFQGRLIPGEMLQLYSPYEGEIKHIWVRNGQEVKAGDPLVEVHATKLKQAIESANVVFLSKEAQFKHLTNFKSSIEYRQLYTAFQRAKRHAEYSQQRFQDSQSLLELGIISKDEFNQDRRSYEETQQSWRDAEQLLFESEKKAQPPFLTIAELEYQLARQQLTHLQSIQTKLLIRAPFGGRVLYSETEGDKRLAVGTQVLQKQPLISVADLNHAQLLTQVDESTVIRLQPGLKTKLRFQAFPNEEIEGTIASIDPKVTRIQDQQAPRYLVRVDFKMPSRIEQSLYFGMTAAISVNLRTDSELYHLPKQAVLYHNQQYWVRKINPETQVVSEIPIQFELVDDHLAAVRQGIAAGDCLVIPD